MHKFTVYDCIELSISNEDWEYLCQNRWFTDEPDSEDVEAEFVSGTGITPGKPHLWEKASLLFHEYVVDMMEISKDRC